MDPLLGGLAALTSCMLWAFSASHFQRVVVEHGPFAGNLFKTAVATGLFGLTSLAMFAAGDAGFAGPQAIGMLALSGIVGMAFGDYALFVAIRSLGVRQAMLIHGTAPLFLLVWTLLHDAGDSLGALDIAGILLVVGGVSGVTLTQKRVGAAEQRAWLTGTLWGLAAALGQAGGIVLSHEALIDSHPVAGSTVRLTGALVGLLALQLLRGRLRRSLAIFGLARVWKRALVPSILGTYVGIILMMTAISRCNPAVAGALLATTPIFVIPFAWMVLGDRISRAALIGTSVAVVGIALVSAGLASG